MIPVEVPAQLVIPLGFVLDRLQHESRRLHDGASPDSGHASDVWEVCDGQPCRRDRENVATLRAALPVPALRCPNGQHFDDEHNELGCADVAADAECSCAMTEASSLSCPVHGTLDAIKACECPFPGRTLDELRALLAAERDSEPAAAKPRVWGRTDPNPATQGATKLRDSQGDHWTALGTNWTCAGGEYTWAAMQPRWFPFTEVLAGGAR